MSPSRQGAPTAIIVLYPEHIHIFGIFVFYLMFLALIKEISDSDKSVYLILCRDS